MVTHYWVHLYPLHWIF